MLKSCEQPASKDCSLYWSEVSESYVSPAEGAALSECYLQVRRLWCCRQFKRSEVMLDMLVWAADLQQLTVFPALL